MNEKEILKQYFGYDSFRQGQQEIVTALTSGKDVLAVMPTGAGKSICYQIPALILPGITIVISPLISLMKDQVASLKAAGIPAAFVNSTLTAIQTDRVMNQIRNEQYKIVYCAPERLLTSGWLQCMNKVQISMVAVDEAHCISCWGHQFRPEYRRIPEFISLLKGRPVISAFTATATPKVKEDIERQLGLIDPLRITASFERKNLYFDVRRSNDKDNDVASYIKQHRSQSGIVYCGTRKNVDRLTEYLRKKGIRAVGYHAGLSEKERRQNQEDFTFDRVPVIVATNAFGMGIDKSNVSYVLHYNMPKDLESYYQEAGRSGRDGMDAECILFYDGDDYGLNQYLINQSWKNSSQPPKLKDQVKKSEMSNLDRMQSYATGKHCYGNYILKHFGEIRNEDCGHCSYCRRKYITKDITIEAQKILSCIGRTNQKLNRTQLYEVLLGTADPSYSSLSTYGIMSGCDRESYDSYVNCLLDQGLAEERNGALCFLPETVPFLKERRSLTITLLRKEEQKKAIENSELFNMLKDVRRTLAEEENVPAYIIFTDAQLRSMAQRKPKTMAQLKKIQGIGKARAKKYGKFFLAVTKGAE